MVLGLVSCNDQLDINRDPDSLDPNIIALPLNSQFAGASTGVVTSAGSYYAIVGGFWSQYFTQSAVANQYKFIDDYSLNTSSINGAWSSMYDAILDLRTVKSNAKQAGNWNYYLMATVMEAYAYQTLSDSYGAVPYSQATDPNFLNPKFDSETAVYDGLVANLKDALSKNLALSPVTVVPGKDDLIFNGNMQNWKNFANTMLLKLYLRQTNARASVAQAGIQQLYSSGATFLTVDAAITDYIDEANKSNPLYESDRRQLNVGTNLRASTTLYSYLQDNNDPRFASFYNAGPSQDQGDFENSSNSTAAVIKLTAKDPAFLISASESYFLQSEADMRYNGGASAQHLYEMGVKASFAQWGIVDTPGPLGSTPVANLLTGVYAYPNGTQSQNLSSIITQKWVSLFPGKGYEAYAEHKRTKIPAISTVAQSNASYVSGQFVYSITGTTGGQFPKRIVYPTSEAQTNSNFPGLIPITTKTWYDAN